MTMRYERYDHAGGQDWMAVFGPANGAQVLIVPPLFEEMNFTRAVLVAMARSFAAHDVGAWIVDLPGTGESESAIEDDRGWRICAPPWRGRRRRSRRARGCRTSPRCVAARCWTMRLRRGPWWRCAGADGAALLRQMERAQAIGDKEAGRVPDPAATTVDLIGYRIARPLRDAMRAARPATPAGPLRERPYDWPGAAPWRRAEPTADPALSAALADDIRMWIATCAG